MKFLRCGTCTQEVMVTKETGMPIVCCGMEMDEIIPCSTDGKAEKHVPVVECDNNNCKVCVGSSPHPMDKDHYIEWIMIETNMGFSRFNLKPGMKPEHEFKMAEGEEVENVYAYCNIHGLWKS